MWQYLGGDMNSLVTKRDFKTILRGVNNMHSEYKSSNPLIKSLNATPKPNNMATSSTRRNKMMRE
jgi:hypothetical protein